MKNRSRIFYLGAVAALTIAQSATADPDKFQISGSARVRSEFRDNADFSDATGDYNDFIGSRFRFDLKVNATPKILIFVQPQFQKIWGDTEYVPNSGTTNVGTKTSGFTNDTGLDVHQGYIAYAAGDDLSFVVGRKELNYGDELLVGGVGWSNIGRSFDLLQGLYKYSLGSVEAFDATVVDRNITAAGPGDLTLSGIYSANRIGESLQSADAYIFYGKDKGAVPSSSTAAYGVRLKSPVGHFDYRTEVTFENVKGTTSTDEWQYDVELGYLVYEPLKLRTAVEYFSASENFDQLYPTGHKWLGYADLFGRRNIQGYHGRVSLQPFDRFTTSLDFHHFDRTKTDKPTYKLNGTTAYGATGSASAVADEFDLVVGYKIDDDLNVEGGAAQVTPGAYLKDNGGSDISTFYYLQVSTAF